MKTVPGPSARPVLLVHGTVGSAAIWSRVVAKLAPGTTTALDLPGFGANTSILHDPVEVVVGRVDGACILVGNGVGSLIAARAALDLRESVRALVLTGPVGIGDAGHARLAWLSHHRAGAALLRIAGRSFGRRKFLSDQLADPDADPDAAAILLDALRRARGFHVLARLNRPESLEGLRDLRCPVTVLWGDRDGVLPVTRADEFMTHLPPHARLEIVPGAGHALPLERPDLVARAIAELA